MGDLSLIPNSEILSYFPNDALWITKLLEGFCGIKTYG